MDRATAEALRPVEHFTGRSLLGLVAVGSGFGLLLMLVRFEWGPMYRVDHGVADELNAVVSAHEPLVSILQQLTDLGGRPIMMWLVAIVAIALLIHGQRRLVVYLMATGAGALILDPSVSSSSGGSAPLAVAVLRRWRPVLFIALAMFGELTLFLAAAAAVDRPAPRCPPG